MKRKFKFNSYVFLLLIFIIVGLYIGFASKFNSPTNSYNISNQDLAENSLESKFAVLSQAQSNNCGLQQGLVKTWDNNLRLQGSCCSKMDLHKYEEQIQGLKKYANISEIPSDPYDITVAQAKQMFEYKNNIDLTTEQQKIYDDAMKMSEEGGPCCCKCWHWDAYEGLAKHLIIAYGFNAGQVAELWDLSDACGGSGHEHGHNT